MHEMEKGMKIGVIGGGPAGLTAAYLLSKSGVSVDVYEADSQVGGMAKSIQLWGQTVDIGPHRFFSSDSRVNRLWLEVAGDDYKMVDRLTRIYYQDKFFYYPLQPMNALITMGIREAMLCAASYFKEQLNGNRDAVNSFENWVVNRFGRRLFTIFFKTYTEKLWGIACNDLDADFASQRIKKFSLGEAIRSAFRLSNQQHKTLVDKFAYPIQGTGMIYHRMAEAVQRSDHSNVYLGTPVRGVVADDHNIIGIQLADRSQKRYDHVISTMPLTQLVKSLKPLPQPVVKAVSALNYRNTIIVYLYCRHAHLFPDQWLYIHDPRLLMGRCTNFRNWIPELFGSDPGTILALEYWCNHDDPLWSQPDDVLIKQGKAEIIKTGLIGDPGTVLQGAVRRIPRSYPVYRRGYKHNLNLVASFLDGFANITAIGRYGSFKYNNQDHSILMGILAAEKIVSGRQHDLWQINTDYETYQESSAIDETGLVQNT
jgi:protoporphyrinogen oxidase